MRKNCAKSLRLEKFPAKRKLSKIPTIFNLKHFYTTISPAEQRQNIGLKSCKLTFTLSVIILSLKVWRHIGIGGNMKGDKKVIEVLILFTGRELTVVSQYMVHAEICDTGVTPNFMTQSRNAQKLKWLMRKNWLDVLSFLEGILSSANLKKCISARYPADVCQWPRSWDWCRETVQRRYFNLRG